jgi:lysophospholipase L1-like esterase
MSGVLAGLAILVIGDSHIAAQGQFNNLLHEQLVEQGAEVNTFGVCSSLPDDWLQPSETPCGRGERHDNGPAQMSKTGSVQGWLLPALIAQYKPNLVVVEIGDTLAGYGAAPDLPKASIAKQVDDLLQPIRANKISCIWIGPPWGTEGGAYKKTFTRVKALSDYLSQIVSPCHYVDSLEASAPGAWPTVDGVHFTPSGTRLWDSYIISSIDKIARELPRH